MDDQRLPADQAEDVSADQAQAGAESAPGTAAGALRRERIWPPMSYYVSVTAVVLLVLLLAALVWTARGVALMIFAGFLLAAGLEPLIRALERRGMRRGYAVLTLTVVIVVAAVAFVWLAVRPAIAQAASFVADIPDLLSGLADRFGDTGVATFLSSDNLADEIRNNLDKIEDVAAVSAEAVFGVLGSIFGFAFTMLTITALTVFLMLALPRLSAFVGQALGDEQQVRVFVDVLQRVGGYVTGQLGTSVAAGVTSMVVFWILGVPYAALLGLVVAALDAVPNVGATLGAIVGVAVSLTQGIGTAVAVAIFFIVYQQVENFVIVPRVFARSVELTPISVFIAVLVGGAVSGIVGAVIALPIVAAVKVVFEYRYRAQLAAIRGRDVPQLLTPERRTSRKPATPH